MAGIRIGYCRTSTKQQDLGIQRDALGAAGCVEIFEEQESGAKRDRPILAQALARLRHGDTFVCWRFDRVARSASHLLAIVDDLKARGINFVSVMENFDLATPMGKAMLTIAGAFAEMEREIIEERRTAGVVRARNAGVRFGRKSAEHPDHIKKLERARALITGGLSVGEAAGAVGLARSTVYKYLDAPKTDNPRKRTQKRTDSAGVNTGGVVALASFRK